MAENQSPFSDEERALFEVQRRDREDLYPGGEPEWATPPPGALPQDEEGRRMHALHTELHQEWLRGEQATTADPSPQEQARIDKALAQSENSLAAGERRRELGEHDRLMAQRAAEAARDTLHDSGPGKEPGAYTTREARERAAHSPPLPGREPER